MRLFKKDLGSLSGGLSVGNVSAVVCRGNEGAGGTRGEYQLGDVFASLTFRGSPLRIQGTSLTHTPPLPTPIHLFHTWFDQVVTS